MTGGYGMSRQYAFRLPIYLVERIDRYAAMRARVDGRKCTRSDALRLLVEKGIALEMPPKVNRPAFETPAGAETVSGLVTDSFELPPPAKKKQRPHRRQDRVPGVVFSQATARLNEPKKR